MDATRLSSPVSVLGLAEPPVFAPPSTKALLFELTDVLYETTVWRRWLLRLLTRMGLSTNYQTFFDHWDHQFLGEINSGRRTMREALATFLLSEGLTPTLVEEIVSAAGAQYKAIGSEPRLLPGVAATLAHLSGRGLALAISADSDQTGDEVREKLKRLGVAGQFRQVISSRDLRTAKPEPVCYLAAVTALGLTPHSVAFVGCRPAHLAGATAAGLGTVSIGGSAADHRPTAVRPIAGSVSLIISESGWSRTTAMPQLCSSGASLPLCPRHPRSFAGPVSSFCQHGTAARQIGLARVLLITLQARLFSQAMSARKSPQLFSYPAVCAGRGNSQMIRNCITAALLALAAGAMGCRACDDCYNEGPMVGDNCPNCGPSARSGSVSGGGYPAGPVYQGQPTYTQPGAVQPAPARQMVPVRPGG